MVEADGPKRYADATDILITADAGGSNGYRSRVWKEELQRLQHRLFSFISMNWRGRPLRSFETVVSLIGNTCTSAGLVVRAALDGLRYPIGKRASAKEMRELNITKDKFHGDWN